MWLNHSNPVEFGYFFGDQNLCKLRTNKIMRLFFVGNDLSKSYDECHKPNLSQIFGDLFDPTKLNNFPLCIYNKFADYSSWYY